MATQARQTINILIRNRERIIYQDTALAVTTYNDQGILDILPDHTNFITLINKQIIIHKMDKTRQEYKIHTGVMKVNDNTVTIFLGIMTQNTQQTSAKS